MLDFAKKMLEKLLISAFSSPLKREYEINLAWMSYLLWWEYNSRSVTVMEQKFVVIKRVDKG